MSDPSSRRGGWPAIHDRLVAMLAGWLSWAGTAFLGIPHLLARAVPRAVAIGDALASRTSVVVILVLATAAAAFFGEEPADAARDRFEQCRREAHSLGLDGRTLDQAALDHRALCETHAQSHAGDLVQARARTLSVLWLAAALHLALGLVLLRRPAKDPLRRNHLPILVLGLVVALAALDHAAHALAHEATALGFRSPVHPAWPFPGLRAAPPPVAFR